MQTSMGLVALVAMLVIHPGSTTSVGGVPYRLSFIAEKIYQDVGCAGTVVHVNYYPKDLCHMKMPSTIAKESCTSNTYSVKNYRSPNTACEGTPFFEATVAHCEEVDFLGLNGSYYGGNDCDPFDGADQQFVVLADYNGAGCQGADLLQETYRPTVCQPYMSSADATVRSARQTCENNGQSTRWLLYADDACGGDPVSSTEAQQTMDFWSFTAAGACNAVPGGFSTKFLGCGGAAPSDDEANEAAPKTGMAVVHVAALAGAVLTLLGA